HQPSTIVWLHPSHRVRGQKNGHIAKREKKYCPKERNHHSNNRATKQICIGRNMVIKLQKKEITIELKEGKRASLHIKVRVLELKSLKLFGSLLKGCRRLNFNNRFRKILDLIEVEVQPRALSALAQFYHPISKVLFQDFQLAPTLDEYECILGMSLIESQPYLYQRNYPSWVKVATMLKVLESMLAKKRLRGNDVEGIP
ncbi:hypothetical protein CR513_53081, partial [Mucuna pruriens]